MTSLHPHRPLRARVWVGAVVAGFALVHVLRRGQGRNYDLLSYHFYTAHALLEGRFERDLAGAGLQSFFNPLPVVVPALLLEWLTHPWSALALGCLQLLSVPLVLLIAKELAASFGERELGFGEAAALTLCFAAPMWWSELGDSFSESLVGPLVLAGVLAALRAVGRSTARRAGLLFAAGAALGLAAGLKLTNGVFALAMALALTACAFRLGRRGALGAAHAASYVLGGLLGCATQAWWYLGLARQWGSPLFPFFNRFFQADSFDPVNFRDWRWHFDSPLAFGQYLVDAAVGTRKTIEYDFADPRLLLLFVLQAAALLRWGWARRRGAVAASVSSAAEASPVVLLLEWFVGASLLLWALLFAYQRYLVPVELLLGLGIWTAIRRLSGPRWRRGALALCVGLCVGGLRVPDWGHRPAVPGQRNAFDLRVPEALRVQPAVYLVAGAPLSYVFAFVHPDSQFLRVDFAAPRLDGRIAKAIAGRGQLPLRVLTRTESLAEKDADYARVGYPAPTWRGPCWDFGSDVGTYRACEVGPAPDPGAR